MKIKNLLLIFITGISLLQTNKMDAIGSDVHKFFGLATLFVTSCVIIYRSESGSKVLETAIPNLATGAAQALSLPAAKKVAEILQKPFLNPIDQEIKNLVDQREILASKLSSLEKMFQPMQINPDKSTKESFNATMQALTKQCFELEKEITNLYERKKFEKVKSNLIFP